MTVFIAALVTAVAWMLMLRVIGVPGLLCDLIGCSSGGVEQTLASIVVALLAAIPGYMVLRKLPNAAAITLLAVIEAFLAAYALIPLLVSINWWVWALAASGLMVISFFAADYLFNKWAASFNRKLLVVIVLVGLTAVVSYRLGTLLN